MHLTRFADLGLRALTRMAASPGTVLSAAQIADEFGISRNHLAKSMAVLSRAGFIESRRGGGGGAVLGRPADDILLGDVVKVLLEHCRDVRGSNAQCGDGSALDRHLAYAQTAFIECLNQFTVADIAMEPTALQS